MLIEPQLASVFLEGKGLGLFFSFSVSSGPR
jgi:hypothetical protein